jgi:hypothetical protein
MEAIYNDGNARRSLEDLQDRMQGSIANWIIGLGILLILVGLIAKTGALSWFGNLPGDIRIKREGFQLYFPLMSMIIISIGISALLALIRRFF